MPDPLFAGRTGVARVALPVPIDSLFSYALPADLAGRDLTGCRVAVRFSGRGLSGVVVQQLSADEAEQAAQENASLDPAHLSPLGRVLDDSAVVSQDMLRLLERAADEVLCPIGIAIASALPAGSTPSMVRRFELLPKGVEALRSGAVSGPARRVLEALVAGALSAAQLGRKVQHAGALLEALVADGLVRRGDHIGQPKARVTRKRVARIREGIDLETACSGALQHAPKQQALLRFLADHGPIPTAEIQTRSGAAASLLRALADRALVQIDTIDAPRNVLGPTVARDEPLALTREQAAAHERICESIHAREATSYLLHGVTGSGKTEVYLRAVAEALALGRQALVLVPEITLTHQIVARLRARFGDALAVLHSGLRPGERLEQWLRLRAGGTPIAVGARSALFAPLDDVGVIVIDEEHDSAYKNDEGFRYHARRLATLRAEQAGCPLILGSATPALETRYRAESGDIERLVLRSRIADRPLPRVSIVDLVEERRKTPRGRKLIVSRPLRKALRETLDEQGQSILFLNRRGFSTRIFCFDCGFAERCEDCDVALVYHAAEHVLCCHYCDFQKPPPDHCSGCGNPETALLGTGTERLEEEVRALFPEARIARLDRDTAQRRGHVQEVLAGLQAREVDILIGTQMVAKGHDFPGVRLVGVIAADVGLHMPDFRAAERTFQLLTQVAGRAGRANTPGRVVLQTFVPEHYAIRPVRKHDYETFYREEIAHRAALHYPPFGHIAQVIVSGPDDEETQKAAEALAGAAGGLAKRVEPMTLAASTAARCEVLGPVPAPLRRLRGRYRYQLLVKGTDVDAVKQTSQRL